MAFCKRAFHLLSLLPSTTLHRRHMSPNSNLKRSSIVDTLALVRALEAKGIPTEQAEAITSAVIQVLNDISENTSQSFISKSKMQKSELLNESNHSKFKIEAQSPQERHFSMIQSEGEKFRSHIEKLGSQLRDEINKNASELLLELQESRVQIEAAKNGVIKFAYCVGTLVSVAAVGLGVIRIFL